MSAFLHAALEVIGAMTVTGLTIIVAFVLLFARRARVRALPFADEMQGQQS